MHVPLLMYFFYPFCEQKKSVWRGCSYITNTHVILGQLESSNHGVYEPLTSYAEWGVAHPLILQILPCTLGQANSSLLFRCQYRNEPWRVEERDEETSTLARNSGLYLNWNWMIREIFIRLQFLQNLSNAVNCWKSLLYVGTVGK